MGNEVECLDEILTKIFKIQKEDLHFDFFNPTHTSDFPQHFVYIVKPKSDKRLKLELKEDEEAEILQKDKAVKKVFELDRINSFKLDIFNFDEKRPPTLVFENFDFPDIYLSNDSKTDNDYYPIIFSHCSINSICSIANNEILQPISFERCEIKNVQLDNSTFTSELSFQTCQFEKNTSFINSTFQNNVYFNNSIFKDYVDFHECEFKQNASFYGVSFEKTPNFSQAIFKGDLNLVNTNLNFDFEDLELRIKKEFKEYKKNKEKTKALQNFANDFRDSFRTFKGALVASHNVLDALDFHRAELYCKEIELKAKWDKKDIEAKNEADMRKDALKFKEKVDYMLLHFYRKLCEHHTDFLRVFNNLILLIALYALFAYLGNFDELVNENNSLKKYLDIFLGLQMWLNDNVYIVAILFILLLLGFVVFGIYQIYKNRKEILSSVKNYLKQLFSNSLKTDIQNIVMICLFILLMSYFCLSLIKKDVIFINLAFFLLFIFSYLWLLLLNNTILRYFLIICAYLSVLINIGLNKIVFLLPIVGKFVSEGSSNNKFIPAVTFAYTILMILVLFSLQKTARKNSIIPS